MFWADASKAVLARRQSTIGSLVVRESPLDSPPAHLVEECLLAAVRRVGVARLLPWPKAAVSWRQRLMWVRRRPNAPSLPDLSVRAPHRPYTYQYNEEKLRIATLKFGTGAHKMVLERGTNPKRSRRTCTCEYGLQSCRGKSAGVARRPRERNP